MKTIFVGPSLPDARDYAAPDIDLRPPACQGDVMRALADGATAIGIIDGQFAMAAPVWHKELLYALSNKVRVFGAASMGALRAAECAAFGMVGIGRIFEDFASCKRVDDADVALTYGPAELGYPATSLPLVNVQATLARMLQKQMVNATEYNLLNDAACQIFFKRRTWKAIAQAANMDFDRLKAVVDICWIDQKRLDALELIQAMQGDLAPAVDMEWQFNATPLFRKMYY